MSCKYNNSMYTSEAPELPVMFDAFEQEILNYDPAEEISEEELNSRYEEFMATDPYAEVMTNYYHKRSVSL